MGPNLYVTPPGLFTRLMFHQDGKDCICNVVQPHSPQTQCLHSRILAYGTVDSGHLCLSGYNEVVLLRRLPKGHDVNAIHADGKGFFVMPHAEALVRISPSGVSSAHFDLSHEPLVSREKDFRLADEGRDKQNEVVKVSQRGYTPSNQVSVPHKFYSSYCPIVLILRPGDTCI